MTNTSVWSTIRTAIDEFTAHARDRPIQQPTTAQALRDELSARYTFDAPLGADTVIADLSRLLRDYTVHVTHPRYFGLFNPSVRESGIAADALVALYNPQLAAWSHAPAACELERHVLGIFARAIWSVGTDTDAVFANFTSGGAESNLTAVLAALAHHVPQTDQDGLATLGHQPTLYASAEAHHSFVKVARMTGLGTRALRQMPVDADGKMDTLALRAAIVKDRAAGFRPLLAVATAGTTGAGLIDPLPALADVCDEQKMWLHVDAAWGGAVVLSPKLRPLLAGLERADSVTWDAHKWLQVPMGAGMFFTRHKQAVQRAFALTTNYMPKPTHDDIDDPYVTTAQWSRRAIGVKVFAQLAELGLPGTAAMIEHMTSLGDSLRERLQRAGWLVVNQTPLPVVCFTHPGIRAGKRSTADILHTIYARSRVWISEYTFRGEAVLRACITSHQSAEADLDVLMQELDTAFNQA